MTDETTNDSPNIGDHEKRLVWLEKELELLKTRVDALVKGLAKAALAKAEEQKS